MASFPRSRSSVHCPSYLCHYARTWSRECSGVSRFSRVLAVVSRPTLVVRVCEYAGQMAVAVT